MEKQHKNTQEDKEFILKVVTAFYELAVTDFLIGYHFRKIATDKGNHPLKPPIEAFAEHIPRIAIFWEMQLIGSKLPPHQKHFDLITIHQQLSIRKGELGRWLLLFKQVLEQEKNHPLTTLWLQKLDLFENIFLRKMSF